MVQVICLTVWLYLLLPGGVRAVPKKEAHFRYYRTILTARVVDPAKKRSHSSMTLQRHDMKCLNSGDPDGKVWRRWDDNGYGSKAMLFQCNSKSNQVMACSIFDAILMRDSNVLVA